MKRLFVMASLMLCFLLVSVVYGEKGGRDLITKMQYDALRLAGCKMETFDASNPRFTEKKLLAATEYLEKILRDKYGDTSFELSSCIRRGLNQAYDEFFLIPNGEEAKLFSARVYGSTGQYSCTDSYYGVLNTEAYEQIQQKALSEIVPDVRVFSTIDQQFDEKHDLSVTIEQTLKEDSFFAFSWILIMPGSGDFEKLSQNIESKLRDMGLNGDYAIYQLTENGKSIGNRQEAFDRIPKNQNEYTTVVRFVIR